MSECVLIVNITWLLVTSLFLENYLEPSKSELSSSD